MTAIDNIMALADDYAEEYSSAMVPQTKQAVIDAKEALRTALTEALEKDVSLINEGNKSQPVREPLTQAQRSQVFDDAETAMRHGPHLSWRNAICDALERAHGIGGAK